MKAFINVNPRTMDEAVAILSRSTREGTRAVVSGGGSDLLGLIKESSRPARRARQPQVGRWHGSGDERREEHPDWRTDHACRAQPRSRHHEPLPSARRRREQRRHSANPQHGDAGRATSVNVRGAGTSATAFPATRTAATSASLAGARTSSTRFSAAVPATSCIPRTRRRPWWRSMRASRSQALVANASWLPAISSWPPETTRPARTS